MKLSRSRVVAAVAAVTVAASGAGVATAFAESPRVLQPQDAVVAKLGGTPLNVRSAPNTSSTIVRTVNEGVRVRVVCQARGTTVTNDLTGFRSDLWDFVPELGGYVADAWMWTGPDGGEDGQVAPTCGNGSIDPNSRVKPTPKPTAKPGATNLGAMATVPGSVLTQEFGRTDFSVQNCGIYAYGTSFGLPACSHPGLDLGAPRGSQVVSPVSGTVKVAGGSGFFADDESNRYAPGAGELKIVRPNGDEVILGHMARIDVKVGDTVTAGQSVGTVGYVPGPHIHLEYRVQDAGTATGWRIVDPRTRLG